MPVSRDTLLAGLPGDVRCAYVRLGGRRVADLPQALEAAPSFTVAAAQQQPPQLPQLKHRLLPCSELRKSERGHLSTGSASLNALLAGGVSTGQLLELCGHPGAGKTQIGLQLAINVQLPSSLGGLGADCLLLDTEGSVMPKRVAAIARGTLDSLHATGELGSHWPEVQQLTVDKLLAGVHYMRIQTAAQQVAVCAGLPHSLPPNVRLVVLDSVASLFRMAQYSANKRACMLHTMAAGLKRVAARGVAVVIMNQVTYHERDDVKPALGDAWSVEPMHRVQLQVRQEMRVASVWKSASLAPGDAQYAITAGGIRDVV